MRPTKKQLTHWHRNGVFHVELPNCIVNLRPGLADATGREMDHIEIIPNDYPDHKAELEPDVRSINVYKKK